MTVVAIIAAGGRGVRAGAEQPKQFRMLGDRTVLQHSVDAFAQSPVVDEVVVVLPAGVAEAALVAAHRGGKPLSIARGGPRRQDSVASGFNHVGATAEVVVVHDGARPFVSGALIARTVDAAREAGAAVAALPAHETVKKARVEHGLVTVEATLPRDAIFMAQTPQAFHRAVLAEAVAVGQRGVEATDEAMLAEVAGYPVRLVPGEAHNVKITTAADLELARRWLLSSGGAMALRVGLGYDLHRLVPDRPLVLGGVTIPFGRGLAGHSDGDAVCHAVTDAILGAAGLGDIGRHFPDTDDQWRGASSLDLLRRAATAVGDAGHVIDNVDVVVIAEAPKIAPYVDQMRSAVAGALAVASNRVSVKGKTHEGVGEVGRGDAIVVQAVALVASAASG